MKKTLPITLATRPLPARGRGTSEARSFLTTLAATGCLLASSLAAQAQFPINEAFTDAATPNFSLGGNAELTGTTGAPGYLRLTSATNNQAGYAVLNGTFPSSKGFSISFEFFSYGGTSPGADGLSVFMVDADGTDPTQNEFSIGSYGGSLGYAQIDTYTALTGVSKGYLGIGLDEFGNYSQDNEGRVGGVGFKPQAVALRGSAADAYKYLTGTSLPFSLDVATARAQSGSPDYRKAYLYVLPVNGGYTITIRLQHGRTVTTTTDMYTVTAPPANLRVGFAGSTGDKTNIHEIRSLAILDNPYAVDDVTQTPYNKPVKLNVIANDHGIGAELKPESVDLDPAPGIQQTYTVPGQGTFEVNSLGEVTFTPIGTFAGEVAIPYFISDLVDKESNPAILTINVTGADVASAISGPVSAKPSTLVSYIISTSNNGTETADNVSPTLQLPAGTDLPASASYFYDIATGLVTFTAVSLPVGSKVDNYLDFVTSADTNTSITLTSSYSYLTSTIIPDQEASNNAATLALTIAEPLPVTLTRFDVAAEPQGALVTWHTATEQHNDHFTVERSLTGAAFQVVGTVRSQGNGLSAHDYSFTDNGAGQLGATTLYYRLRQVDVDGTTTFSPVRNVRFAAPKATATLYPNPSQGRTLLDLSSLAAGPYLVQVLDLTGRVLRTQQAAAELASLDLAGLPQGAYLVLVQGAGTRQALPLLRN
ncbi:T9SS type A sorting domain-containing protein [Hymenobacter sp. UV11]|uniref:T9SS type A sorting domain-containing protein n=1 Tax=Hymenobacter sp. UV11 TaxID=1849735 RepID=UPI00105CD03B|nr:T9SS type A sorting domain-containing protein [Hymenobacter sp. UV11]TDN36709.1 hypothetical protein A8B98_08500 [Hymenobacter sp. UV11]TFZ66213.1 T9SS type A sorting domain-containing protein [Hymenobacter sp. UV11]